MSAKRVLLALLAVYALLGVAAGLTARAPKALSLYEWALSVATMVGIYVWCRADSLQRIPGRCGRWALWAALFPPICVPAYLLRTRPAKRALWSTLKAVGAYLGLSVVFVMVATIVAMVVRS